MSASALIRAVITVFLCCCAVAEEAVVIPRKDLINDPFCSAAYAGDVGKLKKLIASGASANTKDGAGRTALALAAGTNHTAALLLLLGAGADPNIDAPQSSWTPLHWAANNGNAEAVAALLKHRANPNAVDNLGATAIFLAALGGHESVVLQLIKAGAKTRLTDQWGDSPLSLAEHNLAAARRSTNAHLRGTIARREAAVKLLEAATE